MKKAVIFMCLFLGSIFAKDLEFELEITDFYNPAAVDNELALKETLKNLQIKGEYHENIDYEAVCKKINCAAAELNMRIISKEVSKAGFDFIIQGNKIRFKLPVIKDMRLITVSLYLADAEGWTDLYLKPTILHGALEEPYENPYPTYKHDWTTKKQVRFSDTTYVHLSVVKKAALKLSLVGKDGNKSGNLIYFDNYQDVVGGRDLLRETAVTIDKSDAVSADPNYIFTHAHKLYLPENANKGFYISYGALEVTGMIKQIEHNYSSSNQKIIGASYIKEMRYAKNGKLFMITGDVYHESQLFEIKNGKEEAKKYPYDEEYRYVIYFFQDKPRAMFFGYLASDVSDLEYLERHSKLKNNNVKRSFAEFEKEVFDSYDDQSEDRFVTFKKSLEYVERVFGASDKELQKEFEAYKKSVLKLEIKE
jgi:hypothetical protein